MTSISVGAVARFSQADVQVVIWRQIGAPVTGVGKFALQKFETVFGRRGDGRRRVAPGGVK
jgi:hypothetical protein